MNSNETWRDPNKPPDMPEIMDEGYRSEFVLVKYDDGEIMGYYDWEGKGEWKDHNENKIEVIGWKPMEDVPLSRMLDELI
jgi:hypothetical protein